MIRGVKRVCLGCGVLTSEGSRCGGCQSEFNRGRDAQRPPRPHYAGDYRGRARAVRESAIACHICGQGAKPDDPWQADHVIESDPDSPLLPAHRSCNIRKSHEARRTANLRAMDRPPPA